MSRNHGYDAIRFFTAHSACEIFKSADGDLNIAKAHYSLFIWYADVNRTNYSKTNIVDLMISTT